MKSFLHRYPTSPKPTKWVIGRGLLQKDQFFPLLPGKRAVIVDSDLLALYGKPLSLQLDALLISLPSREAAKTEKTVRHIVETLSREGFGRDSVLIAVGGGATMDVVGFVASIYLRGVSLVLVPTSLLAMVDASVGGKTAINSSCSKNVLGSFYFPTAVVVDLNTLGSLPPQEWENGLAEIRKLGLVADRSLFRFLSPFRFSVIEKSIHLKLSLVQKDLYDLGRRRILNFGHTIGHALESLSLFSLSHGAAVSIGCLTEAHLSMRLGVLSKKSFCQIASLFPHMSLPQEYSRESLLHFLLADKKASEDGARFVLLDRVGRARSFFGSYCRAVSFAELAPTLSWMETQYG